MSEGKLAKSAPVETNFGLNIPEEINNHVTDSISMFTGVDTDLMRFFGLEFRDLTNTAKERLTDIYRWAKKEAGENGNNLDILKKISDLEHRLGSPAWSEKRYDRVWNWIKLSVNINDLIEHRELLEKKK